MITGQFTAGAGLLDSHSDAIHNRTVLTLTAPAKFLGQSLVRRLRRLLDDRHAPADGAHPCIGALDVAPLVYAAEEDREAASSTALDVAKAIGAAGSRIPLRAPPAPRSAASISASGPAGSSRAADGSGGAQGRLRS